MNLRAGLEEEENEEEGEKGFVLGVVDLLGGDFPGGSKGFIEWYC